jgi:hypothetical protein
VFPPLLSWLANYVFTDALELDSNTVNGSLITKKFKHQPFTMTSFANSPLEKVGNYEKGDMPFPPNLIFPEVRTGGRNSDSEDAGCTRIFITSEDEDVREKAKLYA